MAADTKKLMDTFLKGLEAKTKKMKEDADAKLVQAKNKTQAEIKKAQTQVQSDARTLDSKMKDVLKNEKD